MSENDSLEHDKLSFEKLDVDNRASVSYDDNLGIFISLLDSDTRLCNWFVACIHTLSEPDDTILLGEVKSHLKGVDWSPILIDFNDLRVFKILEHLIIDIFCRSVQISQFSLHHEIIHIFIKTL